MMLLVLPDAVVEARPAAGEEHKEQEEGGREEGGRPGGGGVHLEDQVRCQGPVRRMRSGAR